jgi:GMP synthase-like glutamine amidotransferase
MLGICRGAQLICALSGGKLVQHQENPKFTHETHVYDSEDSIIMTSTHHQAQYPWRLNKDDFKVLAWTHNVSPFHFNGDNQELELPENKECEVVYYKLTKGLGIQGHPEIVQDFQSHPMIKWCLKTLRLFMKDEL